MPKHVTFFIESGGVADGARTHDNRNHKPSLYCAIDEENQAFRKLSFQFSALFHYVSMRVSEYALEDFFVFVIDATCVNVFVRYNDIAMKKCKNDNHTSQA